MKISRLLSAFICFFAVSCGSVYTDSMNPLYNIPLPAFIRVAPPYSAIGVLDASFGNNGTVVMSGADFGYASGFYVLLSDITIDRKGRILVVGGIEYQSSCYYMVMVRFLNDGRLDPDFGTSEGYIIVNDVESEESIVGSSIKIDSKGRIIVAGSRPGDIDGAALAIWRFLDTGKIDPEFGINGCVTIQGVGCDVTPTLDMCFDMMVDHNDRIITTGFTRNRYMGFDMFVHRITSRGIPDTSFGIKGAVVLDGIARGEDYFGGEVATSVKKDLMGNILVAGYSTNSEDNIDMFLLRLKDNGDLDTSFADNGVIVNDGVARGGFPGGVDMAFDIVTDHQGNILTTGRSQNSSGDYDMVLLRYDSDGKPDLSFGNNGVVVSDGAAGFISGDDNGIALILDYYNRIIVAGTSINAEGNSDMVIWRYNTDGSLDTIFGNNGIVVSDGAARDGMPGGYDISHSDGPAIKIGFILDNQGRLMVAGSCDNMTGDRDMVIWKYK